MAVEFCLLGDVEVRFDEQPVHIGYAQLRCTLAVLLIEANRTVSVDQLVDRVWGSRRPPLRPRSAVQHNIAMLRRALAPTGSPLILSTPPGYRIAVDPATIDVDRYRDLVSRARAADDEKAVGLFQSAIRLWRGEPLAGLNSPWSEDLRAVLVQQHFATRLDLTDVRLRLGQHTTLVAELAPDVERQPLDERLAGQYMLALYHSGRQAHALQHYELVRRRLVEELGADPSAPLQLLHRQILTGSVPATGSVSPAGSATAAVRPPDSGPPLPVPRQLPARPRSFTGRTRDLDRLSAIMDARSSPDTVAICAIGGIGGIGKTWLALHWAYRHIGRFPDGQLFVDLRGFDPVDEPLLPAVVLRGFLAAVGVPPAAIPTDLDAQSGLYRSLLADKRILVVLDNARDTAQVAALIPAGPDCTVLVTSRNQLTGLVTTQGACVLDLGPLPEPEAHDLLASRLGHDRVAAEPDAAAELLASCAGLPLALSVVAARSSNPASRPSLALLAEELRGASTRLNGLDAGEAAASVPAVLASSIQALRPEAAELFRLLGLAPGPDTSLPGAASLAAQPVHGARVAMRELQSLYLVEQHVPGRYRMHDLVRLSAAELARRDRTEEERDAALQRLVDFHVHTAVAAEYLLDPHHPPVPIGEPAPGSRPQPLADETAALEWFGDEHAVLLTVQRFAAEQGLHSAVWHLAWTLDAFHWRRGHLADDLLVWQAGLAAADALGDPALRARARRRLGHAHLRAGDHVAGTELLEESLALAEQTNDLRNQAHTLGALAWAWELRGREQRALDHALRANRLFHSLDMPVWETRTLNDVGWHQARLGLLAEARASCEAALDGTRRHRDRDGEANALDCLAYIAELTGRHAQAVDYYHQSLAVYVESDHTYEQGATLDRLAAAHAARGEYDQARDAWRRARELYRAQHRLTDVERIDLVVEKLRLG